MSDAALNYENTKRNTPTPTGWMLVEPSNCNPATSLVNFWNPLDQCWEELKVTAQGTPESFNRLWLGGSTCLVIKDPNYVAPPLPVAFGGMALPFATPTPFAVPVAPTPIVLAPAPVIPTAAPVPMLIPVAPVAAQAPVAMPMLPTPVTPTLPGYQAPIAMPLAYDPNQDYEAKESEAASSQADPNEVSAWLAAREGVEAQIEALKKVESELRKKIVKTCFPDGLREGANKCSLPDGRSLTITGKVNRTVDNSLVPTAITALQTKNGVAPTGLFKTNYNLDLRVFKGLASEDKALLANCVTEKEGMPQLEVKEAK